MEMINSLTGHKVSFCPTLRKHIVGLPSFIFKPYKIDCNFCPPNHNILRHNMVTGRMLTGDLPRWEGLRPVPGGGASVVVHVVDTPLGVHTLLPAAGARSEFNDKTDIPINAHPRRVVY